MTLDDRLLDYVFQPSQDWWQKFTGYTCFWLAKWCAIGVCFFFLCTTLFLVQEGRSPTLLIVCSALLVIMLPLEIMNYEHMDTRFSQGSEYVNEERIRGKSIRTLICVLFPLASVVAFFAIGTTEEIRSLSIIAAWGTLAIGACELYFRACTPLPPQKSKVRQWIEAAKVWLQPAPEGGEVLPA